MEYNFKVGDKVVIIGKSQGPNTFKDIKVNFKDDEYAGIVTDISERRIEVTAPCGIAWNFNKQDLIPYEELPEVGELVEVSFNKEDWFKRYFLCKVHPKAKYCFVTVDFTDNARYLAGKTFITTDWPFLRRIPKTHKLTIDGSEELELSHESYEALKKHFNNQ
jgi:hypothetical protein